jgi:hypothetical protein
VCRISFIHHFPRYLNSPPNELQITHHQNRRFRSLDKPPISYSILFALSFLFHPSHVTTFSSPATPPPLTCALGSSLPPAPPPPLPAPSPPTPPSRGRHRPLSIPSPSPRNRSDTTGIRLVTNSVWVVAYK